MVSPVFGLAALMLAGLFFMGGGAAAAPGTPVREALERPTVTLKAEVKAGTDALPSEISGTIKVKGWKTGGAPHCLYVPYQDSGYGLDRAITRRQEMFADKHGRQVFENGATTLTLDGKPIETGTGIVRLEPVVQTEGDARFDDMTIAFTSRIPRLPATTPDEWFFDGYTPRLLTSCPAEEIVAVRALPSVVSDISYSVKFPDGWAFVGPGKLTPAGPAEGRLTAAHVAFALTRGQQRLAMDVGDIHVDFVFRTSTFLQIVPTVERTLPLLVQLFGEFPYGKSITIVETTELQRFGLPGLIAVNRAQQGLFDRMQSDWLNWMHWVVVSQLVKQWYGGAIVAKTADDEWLTAGIAEFAILEALKRDPLRFNLFTEWETGVRLLSFTFLQVSEVTAATFRRTTPYATVTTDDYVTKDRQLHQSPLLFIKQAEAMRQMQGLAGDGPFSGFMRQLTAAYLHKAISPAEFYAFLGRRPSPFPPTVRDQLQTDVKAWWTRTGWPDFELEDFKTEALPDGRWLAEVSAVQNGEVDFAPLFGIYDDSGVWRYVRAEPKKRTLENGKQVWHAALALAYKPLRADVDPTHEAYDYDRFNNSSAPTGVQFFPGPAETLRDDAYTVVWVPYLYRLPAQPFSIGLQSVLFRYIQSGLFMKVEMAPKEKLYGGEIRKRFAIEDRGLFFDLNLDHDYVNDRQAEASVTRAPLWNGDPAAGITLKTRFKQRVGQPESRHQTFVLGANMKNATPQARCHGQLAGELERTPPSFSKGFEYTRSFGVVSGDCNITLRSNLGTRFFYGMVRSTGEAPDQALFKPTDLKGTRLRIDDSGLTLGRRVASVGTDLVLPMYLPLPNDTLILSRQLKWRVFYDAGRSFDERHDYRSAGLGFLLPFGGDLAGAGSLSLTKLTLLGILYSSVDGVVSRKPSVVFDLSGDL